MDKEIARMNISLEIPPPRMDWTQIMVDLHNAGCTAYRVHLVLGVAGTTVRNWVKGGEPGYGYGRALLRLHARVCGAGLTTKRMAEADSAKDVVGAARAV